MSSQQTDNIEEELEEINDNIRNIIKNKIEKDTIDLESEQAKLEREQIELIKKKTIIEYNNIGKDVIEKNRQKTLIFVGFVAAITLFIYIFSSFGIGFRSNTQDYEEVQKITVPVNTGE